MAVSELFTLTDDEAIHVPASPELQTVIHNGSGSTFYYKTTPDVSALDSAVTVGSSVTVTADVWIISAATTKVFISNAAANFDDVLIADDLVVTDDITADDIDADVITATSISLDGAAGIVASANGGKDTLSLSNTAADVGITIGVDTNLYRSAADTLKTDDALVVVGNLDADAITGTSISVDGSAGIVASANGGKDTLNLSNTTVDVGITIGGDTNLYRSAADTLKTDDALTAVGAITGASVTATGATGLVASADGGKDTLNLSNTTVNVGITVGGDTNLYRAGANTWMTDDNMIVTGVLVHNSYYDNPNQTPGQTILIAKATADAAYRFNLSNYGTMLWSNGTDAYDTNLYRVAADTLGTDDSFSLVASGSRLKFGHADQAQTTVGAAGAASALPATPTKYFKVLDSSGTTLIIPAYAAS